MKHLHIASRTIANKNFPGTKKLRGINGMKQMHTNFKLESDPTCVSYERIAIRILHFCFELCTCFSNKAVFAL